MEVLTFSDYHKISIYMFDFNEHCIRKAKFNEIGFPTENPPIQVKLQSNNEVDIVNVGGKFISDIKLTKQQLEYIEQADEKKYVVENYLIDPPLKEDYLEDVMWALTSKMRHYKVDHKHPDDMKEAKEDWREHKWIKRILNSPPITRERENLLTIKKISTISEDYNSDDSEFGDRSSSEDDVMSLDSIDSIDNPFDCNSFGEKIIKATVLIEHKDVSNGAIIKRFAFKKFGDSFMVEAFSEDQQCVFTAFYGNQIHCDGVHRIMHGDEGAYFSALNYDQTLDGSTNGIIFCGEQNGNGNNYANALNENVLVPDLLLTEGALANMHMFDKSSAAKNEKFWYNYDYYRHVTVSPRCKLSCCNAENP